MQLPVLAWRVRRRVSASSSQRRLLGIDQSGFNTRRSETPRVAVLETEERDFNFDGRREVKIANDQFAAYFAPANGGCLYELDVRAVNVNLGSTLAERPEAYHEKIRKHTGENAGVGSIHDRVVFKQEGLENKIQYDRRLRKSFQDHFWKDDVSLDDLDAGTAAEIVGFSDLAYRAMLNHDRDSAWLVLAADAEIDVGRLSVRKSISTAAGSSRFMAHYEVNWTAGNSPLRFGVEFNIAALASTEDVRYYRVGGEKIGRLSTKAAIPNASDVHLVDEWLGIDVGLTLDKPAAWFLLPVQTVSGSEAGFELVHQSACVIPTWELPALGGRSGIHTDVVAGLLESQGEEGVE